MAVDANTISLMHFDGNLIDETGIVWTPYNGANTSTDFSVFGGGSLYLNGSQYISASSNNFIIGTGDYTFEAFINNIIQSSYQSIFSTSYDYTVSGGIRITTGVDGNKLEVATASIALFDATVTFSAGTKNHIALSRESFNCYVFLNGNMLGSFTDTRNYSLSQMIIGATSGGHYFNGYIDESRISNIARYTAPFTPPTAPFGSKSISQAMTGGM